MTFKLNAEKTEVPGSRTGIVDLHCDTILFCYTGNVPLPEYKGHINPDKLKAGNCLAQCFALFIPTYDAADQYLKKTLDPWSLYQELLQCYHTNMSVCSDLIRPALSASEVLQNGRQGLLSSILTVEDCVEIDGKIERFDTVYADGVRMMTLTWNYENCIGFPNSPNQEAHTKKGLKPFGFEAVEKMNELGIIIDVSHLSEAGFYDVAKHSKKPFAASHSCCRALADHPRNLTDDQLRVIADHGGVVGINFYDQFLGGATGFTALDDIIRHMLHIRRVAGVDCIAFGSDFDGIESELEFKDYSGLPRIVAAMEKQFSADEIEKICNRNFLRVFAEQES